jgi:DNA-binding transcriptional MerR regulator
MARKKNKYNNQNKIISTKEIMSKYNLSYQTVNHYTDFGLLSVQTRIGNVRFYDRDLVEERMKKIRKLIEEGYSLRLIRKKLIGI